MALLPTIVSGLAGWLTFEDMRRKVTHHEEATLYGPIVDIAWDNGFRVVREFPLPRNAGQLGSSREVDFVFGSARKKEFLVLEVKFKKSAKAMAGSIGADARKIRDLTAAEINSVIEARNLDLPRCDHKYKLDRAVLIVWRSGDLVRSLPHKEPEVISAQLLTLMKGMFADNSDVTSRMLAEAMLSNRPIRPVSVKAGHLRWGATKTSQRYWLAAIRQRPSWSKL